MATWLFWLVIGIGIVGYLLMWRLTFVYIRERWITIEICDWKQWGEEYFAAALISSLVWWVYWLLNWVGRLGHKWGTK